MKRTNLITLLALLAAAFAPGRVLAAHGALGSTQRDGWINDSLGRLVQAGYLPQPASPFEGLTNLEAAESVARASERLLAQAPALPDLVDPSMPAAAPGNGQAAPSAAPALPSLVAPAPAAGAPASPSASAPAPAPAPAAAPASATAAPLPADLAKLVEEFRKELDAMGVDLNALEARLKNRGKVYKTLAAEQDKTLTKTGAEVGVYSRGYINGYQKFGPAPTYNYDSAVFNDIRFRSVPVPKLLFEGTLRVWGTYGYYFVDPAPRFEVRQITLSSYNEVGTVQVGDLFRHFTSLTLYNSSEVHTLLEPTAEKMRRQDVEELVFMDHGEDWHLRGLRLHSKVAWPDSPYVTNASLELLGGPVKAATTGDFANYWAGAQAAMEFFDKKLSLSATGLRFWDDLTSAHVTHIDDFPKTWAQDYLVGGVNPKFDYLVDKNVRVKAEWDGVTSKYTDDQLKGSRFYMDWASLVKGGVSAYGVDVEGRAFNVGPNFYNPGTQTLRYSPVYGTSVGLPLGYLTSDDFKDTRLIGYRNRYLLSDVSRPVFAPYDRLDEAILPYGDSTPNRIGWRVGASAHLAEKGWVKPQAWYTSAKEIEPNWVRVPTGPGLADQIYAVDSNTSTATARTFTGIDAALVLDLQTPLQLKTGLSVGGEYKTQTSKLTSSDLKVDTMQGLLDFTPPVKLLKWLDLSVGYRQVKAAGHEFGLAGSTLAAYPFQPVSTDLGNYLYMPYNLTRTDLSFSAKINITKHACLRGGWENEKVRWEGPPVVTTEGQEWRMMYEASF